MEPITDQAINQLKIHCAHEASPSWRHIFQLWGIVIGQSRESMMAMVMNMARIVIIVTAATSMSIFGSNLHRLLTTDLSTGINQMFTGDSSTAAQTIDDNLAWTQLALAAIDTVQIAPGDTETVDQKNHALFIAGFGTASPPMAAAAMLLLYQFTLALFIGLGPLFILCLIFDQTKSLFQRWLMYGIGTIFSMAVLAFVSSLVLQLTLRVAAALWTAGTINAITGNGAEGFSTQALEQGGLGLLMTVLIISVPPMAAMFFQGTVGNFLTYSAFGAGAASRMGPQGQPPGSYGGGGYGGAYSPPTPNTAQIDPGRTASSAFGNNPGAATRLPGGHSPVYADAIRPAPTPPAGGAR